MGNGILVITLFTIPKAFVGEDKIRQENTLGSWTRLDPHPEIILFCDDPGVAEAAEQFDCVHVPDIRCDENGIPFVGDAFRLASQMATGDVLCYANADIIFTQDLITAVETVTRKFDEPFLIIGQRRNVSIPGPLEFTDNWQQRLRAQVRRPGALDSASAIDYFIYPRGTIVSMPDFLVGSPKWDNWLVKNTERRGFQVVSATHAIICIHQQHEHAWPAKGAQYNHGVWRKAGGGVGHTYSGTWVLGSTGQLGGKPAEEPRASPGRGTWPVPSKVVVGPKPGLRSKPRRTLPPRPPRAPRPTRVAPKDELGLPINLNIPARELVKAAEKLRGRPRRTRPARKKHSHSAPPEKERLLAERARLQQVRDTILAARIEARDARLAKRKKRRP